MTIVIVIVAALGVVCIALAILYIVVRLRNSALAKDLTVTTNQKDNLMRENVQLQGHLDTARKQIQRLENVDAQNADLREALQEAQAEIKALNMNTIEVPEVAPEPVKRAPQRRNMSKKAETKQ